MQCVRIRRSSNNSLTVGGTPYRAGTGSAFLLVKLCPDGKTINLRMESEAALREHVEAMWRYTNGYHLVAVVPLPNNSMRVSE